MDHPNTIEAEKLVREFKKGPRAVDGIDLHVDSGEIYGFLGPIGGFGVSSSAVGCRVRGSAPGPLPAALPR